MSTAHRVSQLWNWLPAFRAVAETQHLPTASRDANLSPSALSRAVKLLEEQLSQSMFEREGRNLVLRPAGRLLLEAVRDAMRRIDIGLAAIDGRTMDGPIRISAAGPYASIFVLPAMQKLAEEHPNMVPYIGSVESARVIQRLRDGSLDLALLEDPAGTEDLVVHLLGKLSFGLYASERHALVQQKSLSIKELSLHPYVGPPPGVDDHFPPHIERRVAIVVTQLHVAVQACATGELLAFLPDAVAEAYAGEGSLVRLPVTLAPPRTLYAVHRKPMAEAVRVLVVRHAIEAAVRQASYYSRPGSVQPPSQDSWG